MATARRNARQKSQLPTSYYEGYLEMKWSKERTSRKMWTCLCGNELFFFNNNKDCQYVEKIALASVLGIQDDVCPDRTLNTAGLVIHTKTDSVKLMAPSMETRELWKGFLLSIKDLSLPSHLNLLPGQVHMMKEAIEKEVVRQKSLAPQPPPASSKPTPTDSSPFYLPLVSEMPFCYQSVSRGEAEVLLEKHPDKGNMLLRPGRDGNSFAVSTREVLNGSVFKHYRVSRDSDGGFYIDVDKPVHCASLQDVADYFIETTGGALQPFALEQPYEQTITFVQANEENGERSVHTVSPAHAKPALGPGGGKPAYPEPQEDQELYLSPDDEELQSIVEEEEERKKWPDTRMWPPQPHPRQNAARVPLPHQHSVPNNLGANTVGPSRQALKPPQDARSATAPRIYPKPIMHPNQPTGASLVSELQMKLNLRRAKES